MAAASEVTDERDRWIDSEIRRLDQRLDAHQSQADRRFLAQERAVDKAVEALKTGAAEHQAARALAFSIIAAVASILGIALAIAALLQVH